MTASLGACLQLIFLRLPSLTHHFSLHVHLYSFLWAFMSGIHMRWWLRRLMAPWDPIPLRQLRAGRWEGSQGWLLPGEGRAQGPDSTLTENSVQQAHFGLHGTILYHTWERTEMSPGLEGPCKLWDQWLGRAGRPLCPEDSVLSGTEPARPVAVTCREKPHLPWKYVTELWLNTGENTAHTLLL